LIAVAPQPTGAKAEVPGAPGVGVEGAVESTDTVCPGVGAVTAEHAAARAIASAAVRRFRPERWIM
jgi:hypothetical protein